MLKTNFDEFSKHVRFVCSYDLTKHLYFKRQSTLKTFAITHSIVVLYRYAEAVSFKIQLHDITTGGHQSHQLGTELDFDLQVAPKDAMVQLNMTRDLLRIRNAIRTHLKAFRIGFYFDYFNKAKAKTWEEFLEDYGGKRVKYSMHLGVRYDGTSKDYEGQAFGTGAAKFGLWGRGSKGYGRSKLWIDRILSWKDAGYLNDGQALRLATDRILADFKNLDLNSPSTVIVPQTPAKGHGSSACNP